MTGLPPTAENFRAEMSRHRLDRKIVCDVIGLNPNSLTLYVNESRPLPVWAAHNIGYAVNRITGLRIFDVDMGRGILPRQATLRKTPDPRKKTRLVAPQRTRKKRVRR